MPILPAYCYSCNRPYQVNLPFYARTFTMTRTSSTCPYCGASNPIRDGQYTVVQTAVKEIRQLNLSIADLKALKTVFSDAIRENATAEEVITNIQKTEPKAAPVVNGFFSSGQNILGLFVLFATILGVLIAYEALQVAKQALEVDKKALEKDKVDDDKIVQDVLKRLEDQQKTKSSRSSKRKPSVNSPCQCGSGKKSKKCCGSK